MLIFISDFGHCLLFKVRTVSGDKPSTTSGVFIANGSVKQTSVGVYVIKGMVRAFFGERKKLATPGVYILKGILRKLF